MEELSILYLRCGGGTGGAKTQAVASDSLSILYLRCRPKGGWHPVVGATQQSFNSLFEMQPPVLKVAFLHKSWAIFQFSI